MMLVSESSTTSIVLTDRMFLVLGHLIIVEMISYRGNGWDQLGPGIRGRQLSLESILRPSADRPIVFPDNHPYP